MQVLGIHSEEKEKAQEEYESYRDAYKKRRDELLKDFQRIYGHMRHGGKVIDVFEAIPAAGIEDGSPRLAICRADAKQVLLQKHDRSQHRWSGWGRVTEPFQFEPGMAVYRYDNGGILGRRDDPRKDDVVLPAGSFNWSEHAMASAEVRTSVPIVPPELLPNGNLSRYFILWEVEQWHEVRHVRSPRDPILLRRITSNIFGVMSTWDLTDLERAVIAGRQTSQG